MKFELTLQDSIPSGVARSGPKPLIWFQFYIGVCMNFNRSMVPNNNSEGVWGWIRHTSMFTKEMFTWPGSRRHSTSMNINFTWNADDGLPNQKGSYDSLGHYWRNNIDTYKPPAEVYNDYYSYYFKPSFFRFELFEGVWSLGYARIWSNEWKEIFTPKDTCPPFGPSLNSPGSAIRPPHYSGILPIWDDVYKNNIWFTY